MAMMAKGRPSLQWLTESMSCAACRRNPQGALNGDNAPRSACSKFRQRLAIRLDRKRFCGNVRAMRQNASSNGTLSAAPAYGVLLERACIIIAG